MYFDHIDYSEGKNGGGFKDLYLALAATAEFPARENDVLTAGITANFAKVKFLQNSGTCQTDEQEIAHGTIYSSRVECTHPADVQAAEQQLQLYKNKMIIALVVDHQGVVRVIGSPTEGARLTVARSKTGTLASGTNSARIVITCSASELPAYYTGTISQW
jgi:hypothetical protein